MMIYNKYVDTLLKTLNNETSFTRLNATTSIHNHKIITLCPNLGERERVWLI